MKRAIYTVVVQGPSSFQLSGQILDVNATEIWPIKESVLLKSKVF